MDADNKARELMLLYYRLIPMCTVSFSRQCALIAVNEMINMCKLYHNHNVVIDTKIYTDLTIEYWEEVKQEIEQL
jgi:hypothetical protein